MENEFITYEQSLALKEIGYVDYSWFGSECSLYKPNGKHTFYMNGVGDETYISAPLKQQVFRWFREKHSLEIILRPDAINAPEKKLREYVILSYDKKWILTPIAEPHWWTRKGLFKTYEEAESACIDKLIEIVKNK